MPPSTSVRSMHLESGLGAGGGGVYDQSLLATTPEVSRAAKQESYNVDLLEDQMHTTHVLEGTSGPGGIGLNNPLNNKEVSYNSLPNRSGNGPAAAFKEEEAGYYRQNDARARHRPWYRRPAGVITIAIVLLVIVGAVVGGAVGGTVGHHKTSSTSEQQSVGPSTQQGGSGGSGGSGGQQQGQSSGQQGVGSAGTTPGTTPVGAVGNATSSKGPSVQNIGQ